MSIRRTDPGANRTGSRPSVVSDEADVNVAVRPSGDRVTPGAGTPPTEKSPAWRSAGFAESCTAELNVTVYSIGCGPVTTLVEPRVGPVWPHASGASMSASGRRPFAPDDRARRGAADPVRLGLLVVGRRPAGQVVADDAVSPTSKRLRSSSASHASFG